MRYPISESDIKEFYDIIQEALIAYSTVSEGSSATKRIENIYIVGSYVQEDDFVSGESDIDIIIETKNNVSTDIRDNFWQYFNSSLSYQNRLSKLLNVEVERVDCVEIGSSSQIEIDSPTIELNK